MISIVVPIFNEEELVSLFHVAVASALKNIREEWEVVYVNDGSSDSSLDLLKGLQAADSHVVVVDLSRNWGHMGAISAGLQTARGDAVVLMDGDFQDPPEVVPQLVDAWKAGAQVVVAVRRSRQERRKILAKLFPLFYRVLGALSDYPIPLNAGIFGLLDRQAVDSINSMQERNRYLPGLRAWVGYPNADCVLRSTGPGRRRGQALVCQPNQIRDGCNYKLQLQTAAAVLCADRLLTLQWSALLGILAIFSGSAVSSMGFGVASAIFLVGSFMLLCLGVIGEYLGRVYDEVRNRPLSLISHVHRPQYQNQASMVAVHGGLSVQPTNYQGKNVTAA